MTIGTVRAIALAIALMLCIASVAAALERKAAAGSDLDRAQVAFQAGRYAEALALARRGADAAPTSVRALTLRAGMAEVMGELAQARQLARSYAIVKSGENYCGEAQAKSREGADREETFKAFRLASLGQPDAADCIWWYGQWLSDEGYVRLGRLMVLEGTRTTPSAGNKESGARYLRVRLGGNREVPKRAEQLFLIARQRYLRDGDLDGAVRLFGETIRLSPTFARPYNYRATIAAHLGDREAALAWLQRGLQADPDSWRTHRNLGKLLSDLERYPEAEMHLRRTVQLFGDDAGGRLALARVLYAQGKYDDFAREARAAAAFLANWKAPVPEVRDFLAKFDRWGPGATLPPAPDPRVIIGWNYD